VSAAAPQTDDSTLVERLRAGDEATFTRLVEGYHSVLLRLALAIVGSRGSAEEVVQDTWVAVLDSLPSFEGRSSLKTWIARIAINRAKTRAVRDGRNVPLDFLDATEGDGEPAVDPSRFRGPGVWAEPVERWDEAPEALLLRREARERIEEGLQKLPAAQRAVVTLRDLEGWSSEEVCNALEVSESNQRVLLHRGRSRLRAVLEQFLGGGKR
jgi:RNA polymerase sigma-70 factor (ECF subfamily)